MLEVGGQRAQRVAVEVLRAGHEDAGLGGLRVGDPAGQRLNTVGFVTQRGENLQGAGNFAGGSQTMQKYIAVGTYYYFNKNMLTYVDYRINLLKENDFTRATGISTKDSIAMGLTYQF